MGKPRGIYEINVHEQSGEAATLYLVHVTGTRAAHEVVAVTAVVQDEGSWHYRVPPETSSVAIRSKLEELINQRVQELFEGTYEGKPSWLQGRPVGPWLATPQGKHHNETLKRIQGWR